MADGGAEARGSRTAEVVDGVLWDYDPDQDRLSPLVSTRRWFQDFPWEPVTADPAEEPPEAGPR